MNKNRFLKALTIALIASFALFFLASHDKVTLGPSLEKHAYVLFSPSEGNNVRGEATFSQVPGGIHFVLQIGGLIPGTYAIWLFKEGLTCLAVPLAEEESLKPIALVETDEEGHLFFFHFAPGTVLEGPQGYVGGALSIEKVEPLHFIPEREKEGAYQVCGEIKRFPTQGELQDSNSSDF